jgi:indole-3-glycerol phosphate synthase
MSSRLDEILAATRRRVAADKQAADVAQLERQAANHLPRSFKGALRPSRQKSIAIIAELKKASPSRGLIRSNFDVSELGPELERAGAAALSVLTEEAFFQGSLENLQRASACTKLPCLRKDFMVDEFQILEARANCADAILLIVAALGQPELISLANRARGCGLDVLCEVHDREELNRAIGAGIDLIGVNNRDLRTFKVDIETAIRLAEFIPKDAVRVAESGIHNGADIAQLRSAGYDAFLIGESLMKAPAPGKGLQALLAEAMATARSA